MDVHEPKIRSYNMSRIRSHDTKPELIVRKYLHGRGLRYSLYNKCLPGKPDLCLKKYKTVVFVNGCFWHGHENCKNYKLPATRTEWWREKIENTRIRDKGNIRDLKDIDWYVIVIWECELKSKIRDFKLEEIYNSITERRI